MDKIKEIDIKLDAIDSRLGTLNQWYESSANKKLHESELCDTLRSVINQVRDDRNELELEKKRLCDINQTALKLNSVNSSQLTGANAVIEDYAMDDQISTNARELQTLND